MKYNKTDTNRLYSQLKRMSTDTKGHGDLLFTQGALFRSEQVVSPAVNALIAPLLRAIIAPNKMSNNHNHTTVLTVASCTRLRRLLSG